MANTELTAFDIFNQFQSRRDLMRRTGKLGLISGLPLTLQGCLAVPDNESRLASDGTLEIALQPGRNCWDNQCFRYDPETGELSAIGHEAIAVPSDLDLTSGFVSEDEFNTLIKTARSADRIVHRSAGGGGNDSRNNSSDD